MGRWMYKLTSLITVNEQQISIMLKNNDVSIMETIDCNTLVIPHFPIMYDIFHEKIP